ncbi:MAG: hypothetical protein M9931_09895 [Chitinophagales bacterium]|nr:hypothetical protein [Chitinophagales bacterium]
MKLNNFFTTVIGILVTAVSLLGQTTYTHSPTSQPSSCPSTDIPTSSPCGLSFLGGLVRMHGTTGNKLSLTITKCGSGSGLNFGSTSSYYIKWSTTNNAATIACSSNSTQIFPGTGTLYTYTNTNPGFTSGTRYYMLTITASDGSTRYYSNVVTVSASTSASCGIPTVNTAST